MYLDNYHYISSTLSNKNMGWSIVNSKNGKQIISESSLYSNLGNELLWTENGNHYTLLVTLVV